MFFSRRTTDANATYWDSVVSGTDARRVQRLWRAHSDAVNIALCRGWWPETPVGRVLKTDLFDEVFAEGLLPFLRSRAPFVCGIDRASEVVRLARDRSGVRKTLAADVRCLPFADGTFDLVVSNSTLDHFEHRREIARSLGEIHRVLRPGGRVILTLDNLANPIVALRNALPFWLTHGLGIVPYFVGATCGPWRGAEMLKDSGFVVREVTAVTHCPRALAVAGAAVCQRIGTAAVQEQFLRGLMVFERLGQWPSRYQTGHFAAFLGEKRG